jgi:dienelactone hydrolase
MVKANGGHGQHSNDNGERSKIMNRKNSFLALCLLVLTSCGPYATEEPVPIATETIAPTDTPQPPPTDTPPTSTEPQRIEFNAEDGTPLVGYYYPAAVTNSPVVVLMHWAPGDQTDWMKINMIDWLTGADPGSFASEFLPASYAAFTFDFRGYGESGGQFNPAGWLMDAKAAYQTAQTLPGVDPMKVVGLGSSIGADAVVDACGDICKGAFSLSPGGYLNLPYSDAVTALSQNSSIPVHIVCFTSEGDRESAPTCQSASGEFYQPVIFPGNLHGTEFLNDIPTRLKVVPYIIEWLSNSLN